MKSDKLYHSSILLFYISPTSKNMPILRMLDKILKYAFSDRQNRLEC